MMLFAISVCATGASLKYIGGWSIFLLSQENNFLCLFSWIWAKRHFPTNFNEIIVHNLYRKEKMLNCREQ